MGSKRLTREAALHHACLPATRPRACLLAGRMRRRPSARRGERDAPPRRPAPQDHEPSDVLLNSVPGGEDERLVKVRGRARGEWARRQGAGAQARRRAGAATAGPPRLPPTSHTHPLPRSLPPLQAMSGPEDAAFSQVEKRAIAANQVPGGWASQLGRYPR